MMIFNAYDSLLELDLKQFNCYEYDDTSNQVLLQTGYKYTLYKSGSTSDNLVIDLLDGSGQTLDYSAPEGTTNGLVEDSSLPLAYMGETKVGYTIIGSGAEGSSVELVYPDNSIKVVTCTGDMWVLKTTTLLKAGDKVTSRLVDNQTGKKSPSYTITIKEV